MTLDTSIFGTARNQAATAIGAVAGAVAGAVFWKKHRVWGGILGYLGGSALGGAAETLTAPASSTPTTPTVST